MSDLNDQSEVCFDHPSPSLLVSLLYTRRQRNLLLRSQQRGAHDLPKVKFDDRIRMLTSHMPNENLPCTAVIRKNPICGIGRAVDIIPFYVECPRSIGRAKSLWHTPQAHFILLLVHQQVCLDRLSIAAVQ